MAVAEQVIETIVPRAPASTTAAAQRVYVHRVLASPPTHRGSPFARRTPHSGTYGLFTCSAADGEQRKCTENSSSRASLAQFMFKREPSSTRIPPIWVCRALDAFGISPHQFVISRAQIWMLFGGPRHGSVDECTFQHQYRKRTNQII